MGRGTALVRCAVFAALFAAATAAGRLTVLDATNLSLVWPAAGVAAVWLCAQRRSPLLWLDVAALGLITAVVNLATGSTPAQSAVFVLANLIQAGLFMTLIVRRRPLMWSLADSGGLRGLRDLWALLLAALTATAAAAAVGPVGIWLVTGRHSWLATGVWLARNLAGILVVGTASLCLARAAVGLRNRLTAPNPPPVDRGRLVEHAAVSVFSAICYGVGFADAEGLPITSTLIALTVWSAVRLSTAYVTAHTAVVAAIAVLFTLHDRGPFAVMSSHAGRALVVQLFVIVVAVVGLTLALGRDERADLVRELAVGREDTARRAALKRAIIDSMSDGVSVVDSTGNITLRNVAAGHILGGRLSPEDQAASSAHYGMHHLDGTPMTDAEMPHVRIAAGEVVEDMDVLIRNEGVPDGRIVHLRASALPEPGGGRSTVMVYNDVTAERRHHDELTAFAGVVAHDLLNPLAAAEGWTDAATEALRDNDAARAEMAMVRVARAAGRMRGLINDLLAYTTARDAGIAPARVDLTALVADITAARIDTATVASAPVPRFTHGELDPVEADHVLLRQLLDNLVGNAVKYTAPGVTPEITITTTRRGGTVTLTIADNGIGIPAGQHEKIFDTFYRAHTGGPYTGTGLGLAICKRIAERHGGTITATDNPGGGTRFTFTLPAATPNTDTRFAPPSPRAQSSTPLRDRTATQQYQRPPATP
ncbi:ATP-binding protein [Actinokineospora auranticolor]|uniref:Sensor-like histidine kinase SenX3 n=1 Tax=Actinokineospora auranticolor TaxID=155976 RepID=A0A2S6GIN1_9PSEU|nr:ATP-binding protein [Actinokineospora auranticolor]PPK65067.1 signal transduction histidine kinase [Actinokineospora auranticolor]